MRIHNLDDFRGGWFMGDFEPSIFRTDGFEVGLMEHRAGHEIEPHYHSKATEYNLIAYGAMEVNGKILGYGSIFILEPNEVVHAKCLTDCAVVVVKVPSLPQDKYVVK